MAEPNTVEKEAKAEAAFGVGFGDTPPAAIPPVKVVEDAPLETATPAAVGPVPVPEKPQYVRVTKQEWDNAKASLGKVPTLESQVAKLTGSMPKAEQLIQQVIEKVQAQTPAGSAVELTDDDFAEFQETFPEVGATMRKSLDKIIKRMNVRGTDGTPAAIDEGTLAKAVETVLTGREQQALEKTHPTWKEIVGAVDLSKGDKLPEGNTFRQWLATQSGAYQEEINATKSPAVVQSAIERFLAMPKTSTPAKPDKAAARRAVIADAETPRAEGNPPPLNSPQSADDAFASGFKAVRHH